MYRIDFISKDNYAQILHTVGLEQGLDDIKISADQIAGTDYFAREPKRLEFACLSDSWINEHILSGNYEHDRYISLFEVRAYENGALFFSGIIDTSFTSYNAKTETVSFTCYDKLRLFAKFSEIKMLFALSQGYHPGYCMGYLIQKIQNMIDINIPAQWNNSYSSLQLNIGFTEALNFGWKELIEPFSHENWVIKVRRVGFRLLGGHVHWQYIQIGEIVDIPDSGLIRRKAKVIARTYCFYNNICPMELPNYRKDTETSLHGDINTHNYNLNQFESGYGESGLVSDSIFLSEAPLFYYCPIEYSDWDVATAPETKSIQVQGNPIPVNVFPKGFYDGKGEQTENLKVLKAVLVLHNLTVISDKYGILYLVNKNDTSDVIHNIDSNDVIELKKKRINRSMPDLSVLDILIGDVKLLKQVVSDYYSDFFSQIWEVEIAVDNLQKYQLRLFHKIVVRANIYRITQVQRDVKNDEYLLKGWQIDG